MSPRNCSGLVSPSTRHVVGRVSSGIPTDDTFRAIRLPSRRLPQRNRFSWNWSRAGRRDRRLSAKVVELTGRLAISSNASAANPRNSSMPPSKEGSKAEPPGALGTKSCGAPPGSNPVPPGKPRPGARSDEVLIHSPSSCTNCGADLSGAEVVGIDRRRSSTCGGSCSGHRAPDRAPEMFVRM